jgi:GNAT superfamily N-acetyltransferase
VSYGRHSSFFKRRDFMSIRNVSLKMAVLVGVIFIFAGAKASSNDSELKDHSNSLRFEIRQLCSGLIENVTEIDCFLGDQKIGFICYTKILVAYFYVIHSFYIKPEDRNKGYGGKLLAYTCNHLRSLGAKKIYIQPGPFEEVNGVMHNIYDESRASRIKRLIALYKRCRFQRVNKLISCGAQIVYKILGIDEDANYLLVK